VQPVNSATTKSQIWFVSVRNSLLLFPQLDEHPEGHGDDFGKPESGAVFFRLIHDLRNFI
jgi:hypothetical protein